MKNRTTDRSMVLIVSKLGMALLITLFIGSNVRAQCDSLSIGLGMTTSYNNETTPFPTNSGRGSKVQYLFQASEMSCLGPAIHGISFQMTDSSSFNSTYDVRVALAHTTASSLGSVQYDVPITDLLPYTDFVQVDYHYNSQQMQWIHIGIVPGELRFALTGPFVWDGVSNVVLELSYLRSPSLGVSPGLVLDTGLTFQSTNYGYDPSAVAGWSYTSTVPGTLGVLPGSALGSNNTRPLTKFYGVPVVGTFPFQFTTSIDDTSSENELLISPNPTNSSVLIHAGENVNVVRVYDRAGKLLQEQAFGLGRGSLSLDLSNLEDGVYILQCADLDGRVLRSERVVVSH